MYQQLHLVQDWLWNRSIMMLHRMFSSTGCSYPWLVLRRHTGKLGWTKDYDWKVRKHLCSNEGSLVLTKVYKRSNMLLPRWEGPACVVKKLGPVVFLERNLPHEAVDGEANHLEVDNPILLPCLLPVKPSMDYSTIRCWWKGAKHRAVSYRTLQRSCCVDQTIVIIYSMALYFSEK